MQKIFELALNPIKEDVTMHFLFKQLIQSFFLFANIGLLFFMPVTYAESEPYSFNKRTIPLLDMSLFQANLGWAGLYAPNRTTDIFNPAESSTHYFNASGMHIALNIIDLKRIPSAPTWILGGRAAVQIFSGLKSTITTTAAPDPNNPNAPTKPTQSYSLGLPSGFFGDFIAYKTFQEQKLYASAFAGVEYDRYRFTGFRNVPTDIPIQIRNSVFWAAGARAGAGFGVQLKGNFLVGVEYTHRFDQSIHAQAYTGNYPYENRRHTIHITGDSVDLVFARSLYDR